MKAKNARQLQHVHPQFKFPTSLHLLKIVVSSGD